jgi:hypothetical protein
MFSMKLFRILFGFDLLAFLTLVYFFVDGLRSATNEDYVEVWVPLLGVPALALIGAWALKSKGSVRAANWLLGLLAAPFVLYLLFVGMFVVLQPDFR